MCLTNSTSLLPSSNMNNSSPTNTNNNINIHENQQTSEDILDVIFDYTGNGDDELTLRFDNGNKLKKKKKLMKFLFCFTFIKGEEVN